MKKVSLTILFFLSLSCLNAIPTIYNITKSNKGLFGYDTYSFWTDFVNIGGKTYKEITINCQDPGLIRCRIKDALEGSICPPDELLHPNQEAIVDDLTDFAENQALAGILSGSSSRNYVILDEIGNPIKCIQFTVIWNLDENGEGNITIIVEEVDCLF